MFRNLLLFSILFLAFSCTTSNHGPSQTNISDPSRDDYDGVAAMEEASRRLQKHANSQMDSVKYSGGNGTSYEDAVIITGAPDAITCIFSQHAWLRENNSVFNHCNAVSHYDEDLDGKLYSVLSCNDTDPPTTVYFDITNCSPDYR